MQWNAPLVTLTNRGNKFQMLMGESVKISYDNGISQASSTRGMSHPPYIQWKEAGEMQPIDISVYLAAGGSERASFTQPSCETADELLALIEKIHDLAMPDVKNDMATLTTSKLEIGSASGTSWLVRNVVLKTISVELEGPWEINTGKPLVAKLSMTFLQTCTGVLGDANAGKIDIKKLPRKNWSFSNPWG